MAGRADVVRIVAGASWGTGFAIAPDRILTALHVVGKIVDGELRLHADAIRITAAVAEGADRQFPVAVCGRDDIGDDFDPELDWAAIRVDADAFPGLALPALGAVAESDQDAPWSTYGFPESSPDLGKATGGRISSTGALIRLASATQAAIQLYSREAGAAQGGAVHGYSGGPVIVGDHVIGLISAAGAEDGRSKEGTLYAIPLTALGKRLGLVLARDRRVASEAAAALRAGAAPGPAALAAGPAGSVLAIPAGAAVPAYVMAAPGFSPAAPGSAPSGALPAVGGASLPGTPQAIAGAGSSTAGGTGLPGALQTLPGGAEPVPVAAPPPRQIYGLSQVLAVAGATCFLGALLGALLAFGVPGWGWGLVGAYGLLRCISFVRQLAVRDPVRGAHRSLGRLLVLLGMLAVVTAAAGLAAGWAEQSAAAVPLGGALRDVLGWPWQLELGVLAVGLTAAATALPLLVVPPQAVGEAAQAAAPRAAILEPATGPPLPEVFHERIRLLFEKRAFEWFRLDGYDAAAGCLTGACRGSGGDQRAVVRCDDRGAPVGDAEVAAVAALAASLPGGDRARVYYATPAAAVDPAVVARFRNRVSFVSEADLLGELVYFDGYLRRVVELYEKDPLPYSHTAVKKSLADTFVAPRFAFHGATGESPRGPLRDHLDDWLADQRPRQIALLADYGMGKSSFLKHYAWHLARARLAGGSGRIPILLSLTGKSPRNQPGADGLLQAFINQYQLRCEVAAFHVLMKAGRLVFLIDAFDEMDLVGDRAMRLDHFAELWRLYTPGNKLLFAGRPTFFPDEAELNEAFHIADRGPDRLTGSVYCERLALSPLADDDIERSFDCYFDPATARRHFAWVRGNPRLVDLARRPAMMHIIRDTIDELRSGQADAVALREASLLRIYTDHWIVREEGGKQRKLLVNRDLRARFSENLAVWMFTGSRRTVQTRELGELFAQWFPDEAARVAAGTGAAAATGATAATAHVQTHLREGIETDLRNCTFLVRDPDGAYSFAHKPFLEYFVAAAIDRGLHEHGEVPEALQLLSWGTEVALHVADLWLLRKNGTISTADARPVIAAISTFRARTLMLRLVFGIFGSGRRGKRGATDTSSATPPTPVALSRATPTPWRRAALWFLSRLLPFPFRSVLRPIGALLEVVQPSLLNAMQVALRAGVQFEWIRHTLFGSTVFHKLLWSVSNLDAGRCLLVLELSGARFDAAKLEKLDLSGRSLRGASFHHAQLEQCWMDRADLTGARLAFAQIQDTSLVGAMLSRADCTSTTFTACRLDFMDAQAAVFENCQFVGGTTLRFASLRRASLRRATVYADLTGADLRGAELDGAGLDRAKLVRAKRPGDPAPAAEIAPCTLAVPESVAWSPDDACLLVRSRGSAWLLDAGDGALIRRLQEPGARILAAAFRSPTEIVVLSAGGAIAIYDLAAGTRRATQLEPSARLIAAAVSGNGTWFAALAADGGVLFGNCADPKTHKASRPGLRLGERDGTMVVKMVFGAVAIDDLGEIVAVLLHGIGDDQPATSKLLILRTAPQLFDHFKLKVSSTACVAVRAGGSAVGVIDGDRMWQYEIRSSAPARKRLDVSITTAPFHAWLPDGSWIDTRDSDWKDGLPTKLLARWQQGTTALRVPVHAHRGRALAVAGPSDLVVLDLAGVYRDLPVFDRYHGFSSPRPVIEDLRFLADHRLATAGLDCVRTWDLGALSESTAWRANLEDAPIVLLGDGRALRGNRVVAGDALEAVHGAVFCAGRERFAVRLRASDDAPASRLFVHQRPVARVDDDAALPAGRSWASDVDVSDVERAAFSLDDRWLALAAKSVTVVELDSEFRGARTLAMPATALAFLGDGALAVGAGDGRLHRYSPETFESGEVVRVADAPITALAAAGTWLAIATGDGRVFTWAPGDSAAAPFAGPFPEAVRLAISPDGRQLAAACEDDIVRLFDVRSRSLVARLYHLEAGWAAVRADGKYDYGGDVSRLSVASQMRTYRLADLDEMIPDGRIRRTSSAEDGNSAEIRGGDRRPSYMGQPAHAGSSQDEEEARADRT